MRSFSLVVAAFVGSLDLVSAGACQPYAPGTTTDTSGTAPPSATSTTATTINGNFEGYDPEADGGIYGYTTGGNGDARLVQGLGYKGDGSQEANCVQISVNGQTAGPVKRQDNSEEPAWGSWVQQKLDSMEPSDYTVRFYYAVVRNDVEDTCRIEGSYGDDIFITSRYFPVTAQNSGDRWVELIDRFPVTASSGFIRFALTCVNGGSAEIYIDQVFLSNQASPDNMDNISLFYPVTRHAATQVPSETTTASLDATTMSVDPTTEYTEVASTGGASTESTEETSTEATDGETTTAGASTTSTSRPTPSGDRFCAKFVTGAAPGKGCAQRPYSGRAGYKQFPVSTITREECAALCLQDGRCQSFQWNTKGSGCANGCYLSDQPWNDTPTNGGSDSNWAYDRSCMEQTECSEAPLDKICVNVQGTTPGDGCQRIRGSAKACAKPFLTTSVSMICNAEFQCRDLCARYPACKSYSAAIGGSCSLYAAPAEEVADSHDSPTTFVDKSCSFCGDGVAHFSYLTPLENPANMPVMTCGATVVSSTSEAPEATSSDVDIPSTTTSDLPSTTADSCRPGFEAPGQCYGATPTAAGSQCYRKGRVTNAPFYTRPRDEYPKQWTYEDCALMCRNDPECKAFGYDSYSLDARCKYMAKSISEAGFVADSTSDVSWLDLGCFTCNMCGQQTTLPAPQIPTESPAPDTCALTNGQGCSIKSSPEQGLVCKKSGSIMEEAWVPDFSQYPLQQSSEQCSAICAQIKSCKSFAFDSARRRCVFISSKLSQAGFSAEENYHEAWSDKGCFDCPSCDEAVSTAPFTTQSLSATTLLTTTRAESEEESQSATETADVITTEATGDATTDMSTTDIPTTSHLSEDATTTGEAQTPEPTDCSVPMAFLGEDLSCGIPGRSGNQAQSSFLQSYVVKPVGSLLSCAKICLEREDCLGFGYTKSDTVCRPYTVGPAGLGITYDAASSSRFYDKACFKCGS